MTTIAIIDLANLAIEFTDNAALASSTDHFVAAEEIDLQELSGPQAVALYNATSSMLVDGPDPVKKFADKKTAAKRLWANLTDLAEQRARLDRVDTSAKNKEVKIVGRTDHMDDFKPEVTLAPALDEMPLPLAKDYTPSEDFLKRQAANKSRDRAAPANNSDPVPVKPAIRRGTGINLKPQAPVYPCRAGSKQAILVDMLFRPEGATMAELLDALSGGTKPWKEVSVKSGMNWDMNKVKGYGIRTSKRGDDDCYHLVLPKGMGAPLPHTVKTVSKKEQGE